MENPKPLVTDAKLDELLEWSGDSTLSQMKQVRAIYEKAIAEKDKTISALQNDLGMMTIDRDHWKRLETSAYNAIGERDQTISDLREALERLLKGTRADYSDAMSSFSEKQHAINNGHDVLSRIPKPQL